MNYISNKTQLLQELQDIFIFLDQNTLVKCRILQSNYVQKCTQYSTLKESIEKR